MRRLAQTLPAVAFVLALGACGTADGPAGGGTDGAGGGGGGGGGTSAAFVALGPLSARQGGGPGAARLGSEKETDRLYAALEDAGAGNLPQARTALTAQPSEEEVGLAFVLPGCQNTGARLTVDGRTVSAELTGGEGINCAQAEYFLATFEIPADGLPSGWTLSTTP